MKKIYKSNKKRKIPVLMLCLLLAVVFTVSGTLAYLFTSTGSITNTFTVPTTGGGIEEDFEDPIKKNVAVTNESDFPVYVRMAVIIAWEYNGIHHSAIPQPGAGSDYSIIWNLESDSNWFRGPDGFYYYKLPLQSGQTTDYIIEEIKALKLGPVDDNDTPDTSDDNQYKLAVDILAQIIQAEPVDAVKDAWNVTLSENNEIVNVTLQSVDLAFN